MAGKNGSPEPKRADLEAAIARAEDGAQVEKFALKVAMPNGREAVITMPVDINDGEFLQLVGILTGPARIELAGQRARAEAKTAGRIVVPGRGILRPV